MHEERWFLLTTLQDVHTIIKKWLYISDDTLIDVILATYLTHTKFGTPVWIFIVDQSGETKTELLRPLSGLPGVILLSDVTVKGMSSGKSESNDLFTQLKQKKDAVLLIYDVATLTSKRADEKNEIWAKFRDLFDGNLGKITGNFSKDGHDFHVTMLGGATTNFRSQYIISNQLGTRELLYTPFQRSDYMQKKLDKAMENDDYEEQMRKEIQETVHSFMKDRTLIPKIKISDDTNIFLNQQVQRLRLLRATAEIDYYSSMVKGEISIETPTRAKKQLKRLIEGLRSLDRDYPKEKIYQIITRMVNSSGNQLRKEIMDQFEKNPAQELNISQISDIVRSNKKLVSIELEFLWKLEWLNRTVIPVKIGDKYVDTVVYTKE
jgi:hypothetical protein